MVLVVVGAQCPCACVSRVRDHCAKTTETTSLSVYAFGRQYVQIWGVVRGALLPFMLVCPPDTKLKM